MGTLIVWKGWSPDWRTVVITLIAWPVGLYALSIVRKNLKNWTGYVVEGAMYGVSRLVMHGLSARLSLRRYCRLELGKENKYLYVPSRYDTKLEVDKVFVSLTLDHKGGAAGTYTKQICSQRGIAFVLSAILAQASPLW